MRDARGFDLAREVARSERAGSTDEDLGLANVILDQRRPALRRPRAPEYSTPECTNPRAAVMWDKAGERVMARRRASAPRRCRPTRPIQLYKNNTDNKGASYGCHENYLMRRGPRRSPTSSAI